MIRYILFLCIFFVANFASAQIFVSNTGTDNAACGAAGSPCATIQFAIDKATAGDVIEVQAGTYTGFNITKSLTINGANRDIAGYSGSRGAESTITSNVVLNTGINNVNLNGLAIRLESAGQRMFLANGSSNINIRNCYLFAFDINTFDVFDGLRFVDCSNIDIRLNHFIYAINGVELVRSSNVNIQENIFGDLPGSFSFDGFLFGSALNIAEGCGQIIFRENFTLNIFGFISSEGVVKAQVGAVSPTVQGLVGPLMITNNWLDNGSGTSALEFFNGDASISYNPNLLVFRENFLRSSGTAIYTGNQTPTGPLDVNANFWSTGFAPGQGPGSSITGILAPAPQTSSPLINSFVHLYRYSSDISLYGVQADENPASVGFQSNRRLTVNLGFPQFSTLQQGVNAVPVDVQNRWILEVGFNNVNSVSERIEITKPMILDGLASPNGVDPPTINSTITSANASFPEIIKITADSVTLRNFFINITDANVLTAVNYEGANNGLISNNVFETSLNEDFRYIVVNSQQTAPFEQTDISIQNNTFNKTGDVRGTALLFLNQNKGVGGMPNPIFGDIALANNIFQQNFQYFIRLDGTVGQEFDQAFSIQNNQFAVPTLKGIVAMTEAELFTLEDKIVHAIDVANTAFLEAVTGQYFITPNSFFAPQSTQASLQRPIELATAGQLINIQGGSYDVAATLNKALDFKIENAATASLNDFTVNFSGTLSVNGNLRIANRLALTNGYISHSAGIFSFAPTFTTLEGGNNNSFVRTALRYDHTGNANPFDITFPVGSGTDAYRPLRISGMNGTALQVTVRTNSPRAGGVGADDNFGCVDAFPRFWELQTSGTISQAGNVTLNYGAGDGVNDPTIPARLRIGRSATEGGVYAALATVTAATTQPAGSITAAATGLGASNFLIIGTDRPPAPPLNITGSTDVCDGQTTSLAITNPIPTFNYFWFDAADNQIGAGTTINIPSASVGGVGASAVFKARYEDPVINCLSGENSFTITVVAQPTATFNYASSNFCKDSDPNPSPTIASTGGAFTVQSGTGLVIDPATGQIDLAASQPGSYLIRYTVGGGATGCTIENSEQTVVISSTATASISTDTPTFEDIVYVCAPATVSLRAEERGDYNYQWQRDGADLPGEEASTLQTNESGIYRVVISNGCGSFFSNTIEIIQTTPPQVSVVPNDIQANLGEQINLQATVANPIGNETFEWSPEEGISDVNSPNPVLTALQSGVYTLTVRSGEGCETIVSINISTNQEVFIPTAFSPNGDGQNDRFNIFASGISEISFRVFDRIGNLVFESSDVNELTQSGWDGTFKGNPLPGGAYVWYLQGKKVNGENLDFKGKNVGTVMIIK